MTISGSRVCKYCGKPYPLIEIPAFGSCGSMTIQSSVCGCEGEVRAERAESRRILQNQLTRAWQSTGVPKRYRDVKPDADGLAEMELAGGLYLSGPKGTGKTTKACEVLKAYVRREQRDGWVSARFMSVPDWLASMRGRFGEQEDEAYHRAVSCKLLVLDDIGKGNPTPTALERLFRLIDGRYNQMRPTIFTSQYTLGELSDRFTTDNDLETADAIVSRIHETCRGVKFDGPDLRIHPENRNIPADGGPTI